MYHKKISFITFTRNSEKLIEGLLRNIHDIVDEIVVIDGFSYDNTIEIAKSYSARICSVKPVGFVEPYRNFALKVASYDWILYLDVDERICRRLKENLREIIEKLP